MTKVIVVGAGHNGLVAAIHLGEAGGLDVTVLEHAPRPGGASSSVESTLAGYVHDHCAAFVPTTAASPAMRELELDVPWVEGPLAGYVPAHCAAFVPTPAAPPAMRELELDVPWVAPPTVAAHPFEDGTGMALHRDVDATAASLGGVAGDRWRRAMDRWLP